MFWTHHDFLMKQKDKQVDVQNVVKGLENALRLRDKTRSENSPKKLASPEGNSQVGSNCPNSKGSENSLSPLGPLGWLLITEFIL